MDMDDGKNSTDDIYINFDTVSSETGKETADSNTTRTKSHEITGTVFTYVNYFFFSIWHK